MPRYLSGGLTEGLIPEINDRYTIRYGELVRDGWVVLRACLLTGQYCSA